MLTAEDYAWFEETDLGLAVASCLTFVKDVSATEVVRRLGGAEVARMEGLARFERYESAVTTPPDAYDEDGTYAAGGKSTGREFAAVCDQAGGAFMLEIYGLLGITDGVLRRLSAGTSVAVLYNTETNDPRFIWAHDGEIRVAFDPYHAGWRDGSDPDALLAVMEQLGFNLSDEDLDPSDPRWVFDDQAPQRALALAHHLTGVPFTNDTLSQPTFLAVSVPATEALDLDEAVEVVPPLYFHDVAPTVEAVETMDLSRIGLSVAAIGEPITVQPFAPYGNDAELRYTIRSVQQAPNAGPDPEEADTVWLLLDVEVAGVSGQALAAPHDLAFVAADSSRYWPMGIGGKQQLETTVLQPGEKVSGPVLFQVPADVPAFGKIVIKAIDDNGDLPLGYWPMNGPPPHYEGPERYPW
ncbi:hypothetical protein FB565_006170 [Actinoplanes lutulentus]|uniref:DUF4352 domain-containing protein n=1 Tax=Actinoplanes lutulentus TaxID=1287878 RepID=A0A327YXG4_9ACTN|nr:DUF6461 domain-containing protein [Actinoplanes lutulentus]MBB2946402.1 hypothetical protein [Actinoplanes lutulentus]RAK24639.1 hypothetical protein B0I29_1392 [Actinoplanes lutulentus]